MDQSLANGVDMRTCSVGIAVDYTKRKHVLRISSVQPCRSELLLQAENPDDLADWVKVLNEQTASRTEDEAKLVSFFLHYFKGLFFFFCYSPSYDQFELKKKDIVR